MKNKRTLLIIILVFALLIGGATLLYRQLGQNITAERLSTQAAQQEGSNDESETEQKTKAPDFTVYDAEGNEVHLSDYVGKPIVLNFWASWCGPCQMEMPDFHEKYLVLSEDVNFLMVNMTTGRETMESASAFIEKNEYSFPVFYDINSNAALSTCVGLRYGCHIRNSGFSRHKVCMLHYYSSLRITTSPCQTVLPT